MVDDEGALVERGDERVEDRVEGGVLVEEDRLAPGPDLHPLAPQGVRPVPVHRVVPPVDDDDLVRAALAGLGEDACHGVPAADEDGALQLDRGDPLQGEASQGRAAAGEVGDEVVGRVREDLGGRAVLGDARLVLQHEDAVAELDGLVDVVGDAHNGLVQLGLHVEQLVLEVGAGDRVDGAEGLVHEQDGRVGGQAPGDPDALLLTAGQLLRVAVAVGGGVEAHHLEELVGATGDAPLVPAEQLGDDGDVGADRHVGEQAPALDDVADAPAQLVGVEASGVPPVDGDRAARGLDEPVDHLEARRLAAAGDADEGDDPPGGDGEAEMIDGCPPLPGVALHDVGEDDLAAGGGRGLAHERIPFGMVRRPTPTSTASARSATMTMPTVPTTA